MSDDVMSADEVAELLGVNRNTVYDAANRQEIPHRRLGRRMLFSRAAIMAWMQTPTAGVRRTG